MQELGPVHMASLDISPEFEANLKVTIDEFNRHATTGTDPIFHRG